MIMGALRRLRSINTDLRVHELSAAAVDSSLREHSLQRVAAELSRRELPLPASLEEGWATLASVVDDGWEKQLGLTTPRYEYVERVECSDTAAIRAHIDKAGFCVVKGCFSGEEVTTSLDLVWSFLERQGTGIDRHDVTTWTK